LVRGESEVSSNSSQRSCEEKDDTERLKLRVEYWYKRLEHTLQHTQIATKLIYIADGAVLGFCYFWITALGVNRAAIGTAGLPVLLLAVMNYFHAGLIGNQQSWYRGIDGKLRDLLGQSSVNHQDTWLSALFPKSTHKAYQLIHLSMFLALLVAGILMVLYGFGCFPELAKPPVKP
jgi:hypothetical protein